LLPIGGVAGALSLLPGGAGASDAPPHSGQAAKPNSSRPGLFSSFTSNGDGMSLLVKMITVLAALVGVVALARLTVGEDFFSTRWLH
jgi:hypothetical protein